MTPADTLRATASQLMDRARFYHKQSRTTNSPFLERHYRDKSHTARLEAIAALQQARAWGTT